MSTENKRFTLNNFMVLVVVIGFLLAVAIPHQIAKQQHEKVNYNVNYLQIKVNDYYRDNGMYPYAIRDLLRGGYLNENGFENPYSNSWQQPVDGQAVSLGQIGYEFLDNAEMKYRITARAGNNLIVRIGK